MALFVRQTVKTIAAAILLLKVAICVILVVIQERSSHFFCPLFWILAAEDAPHATGVSI